MAIKLFVRALVRWSWLLVLFILLGFVGGNILSALLPPQYQATAIVQLSTQSSQIVQPVAAYSTLVTSDSVLGAVLDNYLNNDQNIDRQTFVTKQLAVSSDSASQSITIAVTLSNASEAASLANALAQTLVKQQNAYIHAQYAQELQIVNSRIAAEQNAINHLNQQYAATPSANAATLQQLSDQLSQQQNLQNQDITARQVLTTEQALYGSPLSVVQAALPPGKPSSLIGVVPMTPVLIGFMLILAFVAIGFLEQRAGRIYGVYALQEKTSLPVLGSLRWTKRLSPASFFKTKSAYSAYQEDCRLLMADVLFHAQQANAHIIALTSLNTGAGTTSVITRLAVLLAQSNRRVLLLDANLHDPSLHKQIEVPNDVGIAQLLEESGRKAVATTHRLFRSAVAVSTNIPSIDYFVKPTSIRNLYVITAGKSALGPADLLSMPEMGQFLRGMVRNVDFILIDCPALVHAEARVLGALCDQALLVVDATKGRIQQVLDMKLELVDAGVELSGLIVNKLGRWL